VFEDVIQVQQKMPTFESSGYAVNPTGDVLPPVIVVPDTIPLNKQTTVLVQKFQDHYRIALSDSNVATMSYNMVLSPRKKGSVVIRVFNPKDGNRILAEKTVTIV
jgi:hypothetical protein